MKAVIAAFVASIGCACTSMVTRDESSSDRRPPSPVPMESRCRCVFYQPRASRY